jgi:hypothetical protein
VFVLGLIVGGIIGFAFMALFTMSGRSDNDGNN